jgi:hypothetical protein
MPRSPSALDPELDVAVLAGDPTDPSVEAKPSEQPGCHRRSA